MRIYFAGSRFEAALKFGAKNILQSYFYVKDKLKYMQEIHKQCNFFLDSGAYSAWSLKKKINIDAYISFIKKLKPELYVGLDVIGNAEASMRNFKYMRSAGLEPIAVFHRGSDIKEFYKLLELDYKYIAIGGVAKRKDRKMFVLTDWLDRLFTIIMKERPELKTHGLACTTIQLVKNYPWTSVDSTTWLNPVIFAADIEGVSIYNILRQETGLKKIADVNRKYTRAQQNEILLKKSVERWLKYEKDLNTFKATYNYDNLNQLDMFSVDKLL